MVHRRSYTLEDILLWRLRPNSRAIETKLRSLEHTRYKDLSSLDSDCFLSGYKCATEGSSGSDEQYTCPECSAISSKRLPSCLILTSVSEGTTLSVGQLGRIHSVNATAS